jgi:hypothetical protein
MQDASAGQVDYTAIDDEIVFSLSQVGSKLHCDILIVVSCPAITILTGLSRFRWLPAWMNVWEVNVAQEASTPLEILSHLRQDLAKYFDREELRTLCFDLGIEHENLPDAKDSLARELVAQCERYQRTFELTRKCRELRPDVAWPNLPAHIFICYKRRADPDLKLATYLHDFLSAQGHDVFIDASMRTGTCLLS